MNLFLKARDKFLSISAKIKYSPYPMWLHYQPKCYNIKGEDVRELMKIIEPGDVILRGYEHYIDDFFIGKWSHVGIAYSKNSVIHAMSPKVFEEDIINFFRTDRIVVLRPKLEKKDIKIALEKAKNFLGKKYDFNFDTDDPNEVYCSEMVYLCYEVFKDTLGMNKSIKSILGGLIKRELVEPKAFLEFPGFEEIKRIE